MQKLPNLSALRSVFLLLALLVLPVAAHSSPPSRTTIDWAKKSHQATDANCGTTILKHMQDGHVYHVFVRGTQSGTHSAQADGLTFRYPPNYGPTTDGSRTLFSMQRFEPDVVVAWVTGY